MRAQALHSMTVQALNANRPPTTSASGMPGRLATSASSQAGAHRRWPALDRGHRSRACPAARAAVALRFEPFARAIRQHLKGHAQGLEDLAIEMLACGLSVRDIEDAFKDENGRLLL